MSDRTFSHDAAWADIRRYVFHTLLGQISEGTISHVAACADIKRYVFSCSDSFYFYGAANNSSEAKLFMHG